MLDGQESIRIGVTASVRDGCQFIKAVWPGLADVGLHNPLPSSAAFASVYFLSCNPNGLHLLVDSTGVKMLGEGDWKTKKHGAEYCRQWRKVHLGLDAEILEIRTIEVTSNRVGDAQVLPALLAQIPADEVIASVNGDGAYDTKGSHKAIAERGADAVIPVRKNGKPWKENTSGTNVRNDTLRATQRLGRTLWKKWSGYHRRSLLEAKMRCFKLLGERVMACLFNSQVAELQIRAALLNRFTQLGTSITVAIP